MRLLPRPPRGRARPGRSASLSVAAVGAVLALASMLPAEGRPAGAAPLVLLACAVEGRGLLVAVEEGSGRATAWPALRSPVGAAEGPAPRLEAQGSRAPLDPVAGSAGPGAQCADITASRSDIAAALRSPEEARRDRWALARRLGSDG